MDSSDDVIEIVPMDEYDSQKVSLWPDMQKESWNIHLTKILICSHTLNGTDS
jgi:hypothetical protein